ncbi:MAG: sensor histidine kinase, partial [Candidatus Sericytochromatia bacterium]
QCLIEAAWQAAPDGLADLGGAAAIRALVLGPVAGHGALAPIAAAGPGWDGALPAWPNDEPLPVAIASIVARGAMVIDAGHPGHVAWAAWLARCQARSMVAFPLLDGHEVVGVGLLASGAPLAFSDRHERLCQAHGRLVGLAVARSAAARATDAEAARWGALAVGLSDGLVQLDAAGAVLHMNPAALRLFGLARPPVGTAFTLVEGGVTLARPDGRPFGHLKLPSARLARGEAFRQMEALVSAPGRESRAYAVSGWCLDAVGGPSGACLVYQDRGRLWQREVELSALYALTAATTEATSLEALLERALEHILGLTHLQMGLLLYHAPDQPRPILSHHGLPEPLAAAAAAFEAGHGLDRLYRCLAGAEPGPEAGSPELALKATMLEAIGGWVVLPLRRDRELAGLLLLGAADYGQLSDDLSQLLAAITGQLVVAIERLQARAHLEELIAMRTAELLESNRQLESTVAELRRMDQFKSNFLSNVSHELRTPLSGIIGYGEFLSEGVYGDLSPDQLPILSQLVSSGYKLMELINNLLDLSRIDAGKLKLYLEPIELDTLLEQSVGQVLPQAMQKSLHLELPAGGSPTVEVDPGRIVQVFVNLLANAIKFTEDGGTIRVAFERHGDEVTVSVTDTGIGIPSEHLPHLFTRFSQVDGSATRVYGGTGLGLAICRELIELHGQRIWVNSAPGQGSTFYFTVPVWQPAVVEAVKKG